MTNWCENILVLEGPEADIAAFKEKAAAVLAEDAAVDAAEVLKLENFVPMPAVVQDPECGEAQDEWEMQSWGCTLGAHDSAISTETKNCLHYVFQTPWSPPLAFLHNVSFDWPTLRMVLAYSEPGCGFQGIAKAAAGVMDDQCVNA